MTYFPKNRKTTPDINVLLSNPRFFMASNWLTFRKLLREAGHFILNRDKNPVRAVILSLSEAIQRPQLQTQVLHLLMKCTQSYIIIS